LVSFTQDVRRDMQLNAENKDLQSAENLRQEHCNLKSEIEARRSEFDLINQIADKMVAADHYAKTDVYIDLLVNFL